MPLPITADSLDAIPEPLRGAYVPKDGKFVLDAEIEDVSPLKAKNTQLMDETKAERRKRQELEAKLTTLEEEARARESGLSSDKLKEIQAQAEAKYKPALEELAAEKAKNRKFLLDGTVKSLLAAANAVDVNDAWAVIGGEFDLTDDGKVILKSDPTADVEKYITTDLVARKGHLFRGTQAAGGGAAGQQHGTAGGGSAKSIMQWTTDERAAYIEKHGQSAYQELREQFMRDSLKPKA